MTVGSIRAVGLGKSFPGVEALRGVDLELRRGCVHALVGANGAGKSTLIKIITGYYSSYRGHIEVDGRPVAMTRPTAAMAAGIEVVHQEVDTTLMPNLSVAENLLIRDLAFGSPTAGRALLPWRRFHQEAREIAARVGWDVDVRRRVEELPLHEKQLLVIARALSRDVRYLIFDEPTASLSHNETERLLATITRLKEDGVGILYVSHRMPEILAIADEVTVLRGGKRVAHFTAPLSADAIVEAMLGAPPDETFPPRAEGPPGPVVLEARGLCRGRRVRNVSFRLHRGEILGVTGMVGSGKTELLRLLFGADRPERGELLLEGRPVRFAHPSDAVRHGVFLVPEERRRQGLLIDRSLRENVTLPFLRDYSRAGLMNRREETAYARTTMGRLRIAAPHPEATVDHLSGGNQQKVVIGKWFSKTPRVMLFDEASAGIDVGAKRDVYALVRQLSAGAGVIYASSDIDETLSLADRVLVMRDGSVVAEMQAAEADRHAVLAYCTGARP